MVATLCAPPGHCHSLFRIQFRPRVGLQPCLLFPSPQGLPLGQRVRGWGQGEQRAEPDSRAVAVRPPLLPIHT